MLNIAAELNTLDLEVICGEYVVLDERWNQPRICDPFSRLYFIKQGEGFLKHNDTVVTLRAGNVYLVPAECDFSCGCKSLEKIYFHISLSSIDKYDMLSNVQSICSLPFSEAETDELFRCFSSDNYTDLLRLKTILYKTVSNFSERYNFEHMLIKQYSETVKKIIKYIHANTKINLNVNEISDALFISKSKIRNAFKDETGISIGKYIDDAVFFKAKKLLKKENMSIKEISMALGFCDQFYFSRRFKENYSKTPSEYRREKLI